MHLSTKLDLFETLYDVRTGGWRVPPWLTDSLTPELAAEWQQSSEPWFSPVEREVGRFYRSIVNLLQPRRILETGTNMGYSAYCLAAGLRDLKLNGVCDDGRLFTIDVGDARHIFQDSEVESFVTFIQGNSLEIAVDQFIPDPSGALFDLIVLDSDHTYRTILSEMNRFCPVLRNGGALILHDSMIYDGIALAVRQLMSEGSFEVVNLPTPRTHGNELGRRPGITIARKLRDIPQGFLLPNSSVWDVEFNLPGRNLCSLPLL